MRPVLEGVLRIIQCKRTVEQARIVPILGRGLCSIDHAAVHVAAAVGGITHMAIPAGAAAVPSLDVSSAEYKEIIFDPSSVESTGWQCA